MPRHHRRSWKNLLIHKRYQLGFALFLVGVSALMIVGLGIWMMRVANETTNVSKASARSTLCAHIPELELSEDAVAPISDPPAAPPAPEPDPPSERRIQVTLHEMEVPPPVAPPVPPGLEAAIIDHWECRLEVSNAVSGLERGRLRISYLMIACGLFLVLALAGVGIKMTHRIAGPLYRFQQHFDQMQAGRLPPLLKIRKRDQLIRFYDHLLAAHQGLVALEHDDIERIKTVITAAEAVAQGDHPAIHALRDLVTRKEKSLE